MLISRDREHLGLDLVRVLGLDDPLDVAVGVADDAPVGRRVVELDRHHGRAGAGGVVGLEQLGDDLGVDQRVVAGEDDDGLGVADDVVRGADGAAGAVGLGLDHGLGALGQAGREVAVGRDDHRHPLGAGLARGEHGPGDHRPAADRVQDLGQRGAHARALARGHDQDGRPAHARNRRRARTIGLTPGPLRATSVKFGCETTERDLRRGTGEPGLEPGFPGPKPGVMPVRPLPTGACGR